MFNKKSSTTTSNKKKPSERIKKTIKSIVSSNDTKKNAADAKNKITPVLNNDKRSETKPVDVGQKVLPKQKNGSNESDEKTTIGKPPVDKSFDVSKTKADESKNNSGSIKPEKNNTIKKRLSVASISSLSSVTSNAETKNHVADSKRRMSSAIRSETSSRPSTPDIIKRQPSSKISQHPSRPATPDIIKKQPSSKINIIKKQPSSKINQHPSRSATPDIIKKQSSSKISQHPSRPTSPDIIKKQPSSKISQHPSRPATPDIIKKQSSSKISQHPSRPTSPDIIKKQPSSKISQHPSRPTSPDITRRPTSSRLTVHENSTSEITRRASTRSLSSAAKRPTSIISSTNSNTNSRPASPELSKTTKRPTSIISVTNSQPAVLEVKAKQSGSTKPHDSTNIITKSKQLSQPTPPTQGVTNKQNISQSSRSPSRSPSRPPSPEVTKFPEPPLISGIAGKPSTSKPSRPSTPDITKSSTTETTRKRSVSRPPTFEIKPELTRPSQISDDSYFQRPLTPTSDTSAESNEVISDDYNTSSIDVNNNNIHEETNNDQLFTKKWIEENNNNLSLDMANDKMCLVIDKNSTEFNSLSHEDINQHKIDDSEQEVASDKTCVSTLDSSDNSTVIETSLEHTEISNDKICNISVLSDNNNHKNELQDEQDNSIQENNQNIDIKESTEILDESSEEVKIEKKPNAVELVNSMMQKIKTMKNVIDINGSKLPAIIEQDLDLEQHSVEEIVNSINLIENEKLSRMTSDTSDKLDNKKHDLNPTEMVMDCEKPRILVDCATEEQIFSSINLSGREQMSQDINIENNNTLNDNLNVMQNNILFLSSEPAIIEHRTISVYAEPYKKYVGSYGTSPQDFIPITNYETQDNIMRVDEKRFEVMRQNVLGSSVIGYKENTFTGLLKEPNTSTENLLNSIDSIQPSLSNNLDTKEEQQYYDVSISEGKEISSKL
ncbi:6646_t:CDS:2 [Dentiscutata erythropus]|uniref:6646_t:CDS:1 n=1 Tax=Dentiscutata erythropus TaxID=1348616 RepID=A0A9N9DQA3_9GLOM|nr:6646_t:CDS:2 [Dentiscutata erythropus]